MPPEEAQVRSLETRFDDLSRQLRNVESRVMSRLDSVMDALGHVIELEEQIIFLIDAPPPAAILQLKLGTPISQ